MKKKILSCVAFISIFSLIFLTMSASVQTAQSGSTDTTAGPTGDAGTTEKNGTSGDTGTTEENGTSGDIGTTGAYSSKEEVIYALLDTSGLVNQIYAVNILNVTSPGLVTDYGSYSSVKNLTTTDDLMVSEDMVTLGAQPGRFYYQGSLTSTKLPWDTRITYSLDGTPISASELPGKSGKLAITVATKAAPEINPSFYDSYLLQVSITLDTGRCSNITAPGATLANSGSDKLITFTVLPKSEGNMTVKADVVDFEMEGIQISAVPYTMNIDLPDISGYTDDFILLADAISGLHDGITSLTNGVSELNSGTLRLKSGSSDFNSGLLSISSNSAKLISASGEISGALSSVSKMLSDASTGTDISSLAQLPAVLSQLSSGLDEIAGGLTELADNYGKAYNALDQAVSSIPVTEIPQSALQNLMINNPADDTVSQLIEYYTAARTVAGTYQMVSPAFEAVKTNLPTISSNITTIADTLDTIGVQLSTSLEESELMSSIAGLSAGIAQLSESYDQFDTGLLEYTGGVTQLADAYAAINNGISSLEDGTGELESGMLQLREGASELDSQTKTMPGQIENSINDLLAAYDSPDIAPVSFVSAKNDKVTAIQFVLTTEKIEKPVATEVQDEEKPTESFWDRLLDLFR